MQDYADQFYATGSVAGMVFTLKVLDVGSLRGPSNAARRSVQPRIPPLPANIDRPRFPKAVCHFLRKPTRDLSMAREFACGELTGQARGEQSSQVSD